MKRNEAGKVFAVTKCHHKAVVWARGTHGGCNFAPCRGFTPEPKDPILLLLEALASSVPATSSNASAPTQGQSRATGPFALSNTQSSLSGIWGFVPDLFVPFLEIAYRLNDPRYKHALADFGSAPCAFRHFVMQIRLQLCSVYLKEVEGKLIQLRNSMVDDSEGKSKGNEALGFIEQAHLAVSQTQQLVGELQRARNKSAKRQSA